MTYKPSLELIDKHNIYLSLLPTQQDTDGFIEYEKCDSLLFSCLTGCVPGVYLLPWMAADCTQIPIKWYRRSGAHGECYASGGSTSEISRDMFCGLLWYAWCKRRADIAESVCDYAIRHFGVMGRGKLSQTLMSPSLLNTFACISHKLGGKSYPLLRLLPCYISSDLQDYQRHLAVLHALLRQKMGLKVDVKVFDKAMLAQSQNPLFNYAAGFPEAADHYLKRLDFWPANRLPTNRDRAEAWLLQRDWGPDWRPAEDGEETKQYSGGDFLFVSALLQGLI